MPWTRAHRKGIPCTLCLDHILASASLPLFFPAVNIGGCWYGDGGIRMTAPLSPAVHLGADRILAISTKYAPSSEEADCTTINSYPPPVQVLGALYNALFLDVFDYDALRIERINSLVKHVPLDKRDGLRCVDLLLLRPSRDLGKLANAYEADLPRRLPLHDPRSGHARDPIERYLERIAVSTRLPETVAGLGLCGCRERAARKSPRSLRKALYARIRRKRCDVIVHGVSGFSMGRWQRKRFDLGFAMDRLP